MLAASSPLAWSGRLKAKLTKWFAATTRDATPQPARQGAPPHTAHSAPCTHAAEKKPVRAAAISLHASSSPAHRGITLTPEAMRPAATAPHATDMSLSPACAVGLYRRSAGSRQRQPSQQHSPRVLNHRHQPYSTSGTPLNTTTSAPSHAMFVSNSMPNHLSPGPSRTSSNAEQSLGSPCLTPHTTCHQLPATPTHTSPVAHPFAVGAPSLYDALSSGVEAEPGLGAEGGACGLLPQDRPSRLPDPQPLRHAMTFPSPLGSPSRSENNLLQLQLQAPPRVHFGKRLASSRCMALLTSSKMLNGGVGAGAGGGSGSARPSAGGGTGGGGGGGSGGGSGSGSPLHGLGSPRYYNKRRTSIAVDTLHKMPSCSWAETPSSFHQFRAPLYEESPQERESDGDGVLSLGPAPGSRSLGGDRQGLVGQQREARPRAGGARPGSPGAEGEQAAPAGDRVRLLMEPELEMQRRRSSLGALDSDVIAEEKQSVQQQRLGARAGRTTSLRTRVRALEERMWGGEGACPDTPAPAPAPAPAAGRGFGAKVAPALASSETNAVFGSRLMNWVSDRVPGAATSAPLSCDMPPRWSCGVEPSHHPSPHLSESHVIAACGRDADAGRPTHVRRLSQPERLMAFSEVEAEGVPLPPQPRLSGTVPVHRPPTARTSRLSLTT